MRGGVRVIYYSAVVSDVILMPIDRYGKNERDDLTKDRLKTLGQNVREEFK